ncbi:2,3,4,5-tetrahydropyridine-2,6-dicarboxylate N-succinyltransferase [bacterium]|nr:2,3,4,5-tetrahydropyridine-2,6-dicarboxylate N-succinyltransferase [bacterium]
MRSGILDLWERTSGEADAAEALALFRTLKDGLNRGEIRAAEPVNGVWTVNEWVKKGILLGFRFGSVQDMSLNDSQPFFDKQTFPLKRITLENGIRIVPGGSSIRDGAYVAPRVTCMPPMYINTGAYVDQGTMIDSHALVGSCAQVGKRVHVSAAAQIGGVLEPVGSLPVIIEDDVLIGGNSGIYEGTIVRSRAIIGAGVILTASTPVYDLVAGAVYSAAPGSPLEIPEGAVVIPGTRPVSRGAGQEWGISIYTPVIVKYRDDKTETAVTLEELLR